MERKPADGSDGTSETTSLQLEGSLPPGAVVAELARGTVLGGRYVIQKVLGRGGTGLVLLAFDRVIEADVAVKVLRPEYAADRHRVDRLAREVKVARAIQHPNVCRIFGSARPTAAPSSCRNLPVDGDSPVNQDVWVTGSYRSEVRIVDNP
jgi:hypothetical protein